MLYTAQYRYPGKDRLDITVKGNDVAGKIYAPTWPMVQGFKNKTITEAEYTKQYYELIVERWEQSKEFVERTMHLVDTFGKNDENITLVCFCPSNTFCHRYLLVKFLQHNWKIEYGGERSK
jgi:uncharacterized protein YeaO (DUF488 family)